MASPLRQRTKPDRFAFTYVLAVGALLAVLGAAPARAAEPQIIASWASGISATSGRLSAEINPSGSGTSYHFEYVTQEAFDRKGFAEAVKAPVGPDPKIGSGSAAVTVSQSPGGLMSETAYRYRVIAASSAGTAVGTEHSFITRAFGGPLVLSDHRGWEMVSPADKNGGEVSGFGGGGDVLQAAEAGDAVSFGSTSSFGEAALGSPAISQYVARRGGQGWTNENVSVPQVSGGYGEGRDANPYLLFAPDLATALLSNGQRCRGISGDCAVANPPLPDSGAPVGYRNYYLRGGSGRYEALLTGADVGSLTIDPQHFEVRFVGAAPDLRQVVLSTCAALTSEASEVPSGDGCDPAATNLYLWSQGRRLSLLNVLPGAAGGTSGAALAAPVGAVSNDGSRVYWTAGGSLYLREPGVTKQVDEMVGGGGRFETATADGSVAFFTKDGHLFRYEEASGASTDLAPGGGVEGVLGASTDGAYVYYLAAAGLMVRHGGTTTAVASAADASSYPPASGTARISVDGSRLAFLSTASLTGYDNVGQLSGGPVTEVFLYDANGNGGAGKLVCASCNPTLGRPLGPSTIPGAVGGGEGPDAIPAYKPRALSADGSRLFFDSADSLVPQDTNNRPDVYKWEAAGAGDCQQASGCLNLVSSGRSPQADSRGASFADASLDGGDAFFLTDSSLVPSDPGSIDLYDARVGGGFPVPSAPIPCDGDACQPLPSQPEDPTPGTLVRGASNPPLSFGRPRKRKAPRRSHRKRGRNPHHRGHSR
jgi:hypothetical protein